MYLLFGSTKLYPLQIHTTKAIPRDSTRVKIIILVNVDIKNRIKIDKIFLRCCFECLGDFAISKPLFKFRGLDCIKNDTFYVVSDQDFSKIKHLQHRAGRIVADGVSFQDIFCTRHFPRQPSLTERCVDAQNVR